MRVFVLPCKSRLPTNIYCPLVPQATRRSQASARAALTPQERRECRSVAECRGVVEQRLLTPCLAYSGPTASLSNGGRPPSRPVLHPLSPSLSRSSQSLLNFICWFGLSEM